MKIIGLALLENPRQNCLTADICGRILESDNMTREGFRFIALCSCEREILSLMVVKTCDVAAVQQVCWMKNSHVVVGAFVGVLRSEPDSRIFWTKMPIAAARLHTCETRGCNAGEWRKVLPQKSISNKAACCSHTQQKKIAWSNRLFLRVLI